MNRVLELVATGLFLASAAEAVAFCAIYLRRPWRSRTGVAIMIAEASVAAVTLGTILFSTVGEIPGAYIVQTAILLLLFAGQTAMLALLYQTRRKS